MPGQCLTGLRWVPARTLRSGAWRGKAALLRYVQPANLNLLLQVWEPPPHVFDVTQDSPSPRPLPPGPKHLPACQTLTSHVWFLKNGPMVQSALARKCTAGFKQLSLHLDTPGNRCAVLRMAFCPTPQRLPPAGIRGLILLKDVM